MAVAADLDAAAARLGRAARLAIHVRERVRVAYCLEGLGRLLEHKIDSDRGPSGAAPAHVVTSVGSGDVNDTGQLQRRQTRLVPSMHALRSAADPSHVSRVIKAGDGLWARSTRATIIAEQGFENPPCPGRLVTVCGYWAS